MTTTNITNFDQFILNLATQLLGAPKVLQLLQEHQPTNSIESDSSNENRRHWRTTSNHACYWRTQLQKNDTSTIHNTASLDNGSNSPEPRNVYFVDVSFDFSSSHPLVMFGILMQSTSSAAVPALYVKSLPCTFAQWRRHFDDVGVDVDDNDARTLANSMAQSLKLGSITNVTFTGMATTTESSSAQQEVKASPLITLDISYQDLAATGKLQLEVQHSSEMDVTLLDLITSNAFMADEMVVQQKLNDPSRREHAVEDDTRALAIVQNVLDLWRERMEHFERARVVSENIASKQRQQQTGTIVAAGDPSESSSTNQPLESSTHTVDLPEATLQSAAAPSAAESATTSNGIPNVNGSSNGKNATVIVKRVVSKKAAGTTKAVSKKRRREVGGKLTYANNS